MLHPFENIKGRKKFLGPFFAFADDSSFAIKLLHTICPSLGKSGRITESSGMTAAISLFWLKANIEISPGIFTWQASNSL